MIRRKNQQKEERRAKTKEGRLKPKNEHDCQTNKNLFKRSWMRF